MLIADFLSSLGEALWTKFYQICFVIDGTLSKLIYGVFSVFMSLAETRIFSSDIVSDLTNRSYIVISIIMLFVLAYSILRMMINPDEITKGKFSGFAVVKRIVIAIFVIAFTPAIFDFSYGLQHSVLKNNVVGKVITGTNSDSITDSAAEFTTSIFTANCYLSNHYSDEAKEEYDAAKEVALASGDISEFQNLIPYIVNQQVVYHNFISLIVNGIILYVLVTFCFDMAIRVVKLAFLQLITPIPAIMYILPGQEGSLSKWIKESAKCFFEVIVRLAVMYFTIFLFLIINRKIDSGVLFESMGVPTEHGVRVFSVVVYSMTKYFVIFGLLAFMKQAPKLISDLFGIKSDKGTFDLKQRVKDSIGTVYNPARKVVDKTVGAAGGLAAGLIMYNKGKKAGVSGSASKAALASFNGIRNGFRGGIRKGISGAYDYEYIMQSAYAQQPDEKHDIKTAVMDSMRDNFGFLSRYDSIKRDKQLERDVYNSTRYENVRSVDDKLAPVIENIDAQHKVSIDVKQDASSAADGLAKAASATVGKVDSQNKVTLKDMIQGNYAKVVKDQNDDLKELEKFNGKLSSFGFTSEKQFNDDKAQFDSVKETMATEGKTEDEVLSGLNQNQRESYERWKKFDDHKNKWLDDFKNNKTEYDKRIEEIRKKETEGSISKVDADKQIKQLEKEKQEEYKDNYDTFMLNYKKWNELKVKSDKSKSVYDQTLKDLDALKKVYDIDFNVTDDGKITFTRENDKLNESFNAHAIESFMSNVSAGKFQDANGVEVKDADAQMAINRVFDFGNGKILADYLDAGMKNVYNFTAEERVLYEKLKQELNNQQVGYVKVKNEATGEYDNILMKDFSDIKDGQSLAKLSKKINELIQTENEAIVNEKSNVSATVRVFVTDEHGNRVPKDVTMTAYQAEQFKKREKEEAEAKNKETERILESMENLVKAQKTRQEAKSKADSIKNGKH